MGFLGSFLSDIVKLPEKAAGGIGDFVSNASKVIVKAGSKIGDFVSDIPDKMKNEIGKNIDFVLAQVEKVQDLGVKGVSKVGDAIVKNPAVGGVLAAGAGISAATVAAIALGGIFILKKF